ncbi:MAG: hypothetical protein KTR30_29660, partial [Saprospiraceae bacterium]|nr:hypothetical protein [Saprospiraceae bacterium]
MIPSVKIDTTRKKAFPFIIPILLLCFGANYAQPNLTANSQPHTISYNSGNKVQEFTLPNTITSGRIQFDTYGGDGGFKKNYPSQVSVRAKGGQGAVIKATFPIGQGPGKIPPGARILFIPGEHGQNRSNAFANGAGGGGGSAVFFQEANGHWTMLAVAGGGRGGAADCCLIQEDGRPGEPHGCVLIGTNQEGSNDYCFYTGTLITSLCNAGGSAFTDNANASSWSPVSSSNCDACLVGKMGWPGASSIPTNAVKPTGGYGGGYKSNGNACTDLDRKGGFGFGGGGIGSTGGGFNGGGAGGGFTSHIDRGGGSYLNEGLALADYPRERIRRSSTTDPQHGKIIYTITSDPVVLCHNKTATLTNSNPTYIPFNTLAEVTSNPAGSTFLYSNSNFELEGVSFDCADLGPQTVNFLVLENGTSFYQACTVTVTVVDGGAPSVSCNNISVTTDANGQAIIDVGQVFQNYQDNCTVSPSSLSLDRTSFNYTEDCEVNGQTKTETVTLTAQDDNGNQASCTSTVTIVLQVADSTPPQALCKDITMALNGQSQVSIMSGQLDAASFDNCSTVSTQLQQPNVFLEVKGDRFVRETSWQITSLDGNTVHASIAPYSLPYISADAALRPTDFSYNITLDPGCYLFVWNDGIFSDGFLCAEEGGTFYYELTDDSGNVITYDECEGIKGGSTTQFCVSNAPTLVNELVFDCQDEGIQEVNLTVTNEEGLQSTCTSTVTIVNSVPSCPTAEVEVQLPETGLATLIASELGTATADACGDPLRYGFKQASLQLEIQSDGWNNDFWWEITSADGQTIYDSGSGYPSDLDPSIPDLQQRRLAQIRHFVVDIPFPRHGNFIFKWKDSFVDGFLCAEDNADYFYRLTTSTGAVLAYGECESIGGGVDTPFSLSHNNNPGNAWYHVADKVFSCSNAGYHYATVSTITSTGRVMDCKRVIKVKPPAPVAICENITVELDINNQATFSIDDINNTTLPCNGYQITSTEPSFTTFDCSDIGTQTVALTVSDVYEQESTCTAFISVRDNTPPKASCKNLSVQLNENGQVSIDANQFDAGSIDNCSVNRLYFDDYQSTRTFSCDQVGTINLWNMILEDNAGLLDYCDVVLTILDNTPPAAKCQDISIELDHNGQANITPDMIDKNSSDNCGIATIDLDLKEFSCSNVGISNTVNLTVTDIYNNSSSCTASVSVEDHIAPEIDCVDISVALQNDGTVGVGAELIADQVSDNCSFTIFDTPFKASCSDVGIVPFTFSAIDASGNESSCTINVNIEDNTVPIARCQNVTIQLDANGTGSSSATVVDNGSNDSCGIESLSLSKTDFTCADLGEQQEILTVIDIHGNTSACNVIITVLDEIQPTLTCPQDMSINTDEGECGANVTLPKAAPADNCAIAELKSRYRALDESGTLNDNWSAWESDHSGFFELGSYQIEWRARDAAGNEEYCSFKLEIVDQEAPEVICVNATITFNGEEQLAIPPSSVFDELASFDACGAITFLSQSLTQVNCAEVGNTIDVQVVGIDPHGNTNTCTAQITVAGQPCGFTATGIDCETGAAASYDPVAETFTLSAQDCNGYPDGEVSFVGTTLCGDGEIIVHVDAINPYARAGVVMMESSDPGARLVALVIDLSPRVRTEYRVNTNGALSSKNKNRSGVDWLRIVRTGNTFKTYTSTDGDYWKKAHTIEYESFEDCIEVGLITYTKDVDEEAVAVFSQLEITGENSSYSQPAIPALATDARSLDTDVQLQVSPNPFSAQAKISFELSESAEVNLTIYNLQGQAVKHY